MRKRSFGKTGVQLPVIGQGTWQISSTSAAVDALRVGVDQGLTHVDTAEMYTGAEGVMREAFTDMDRDALFLASKVLPRNASYEGTRKALEATLERLGTSHVDLYYLHWWSSKNPIEETMRAMEDLVDEGKVRHIGVSNFDVPELEKAQAALKRHELAANQVLYNLEAREAEGRLLDHCRENGIALVGYSPLGGSRGFTSPDSKRGRVLVDVAERHDATPQQVALNFLSREEGVFLIPKAEKVAHVRANAAALDFTLTREDVDAIESAFPAPAHDEALQVF